MTLTCWLQDSPSCFDPDTSTPFQNIFYIIPEMIFAKWKSDLFSMGLEPFSDSQKLSGKVLQSSNRGKTDGQRAECIVTLHAVSRIACLSYTGSVHFIEHSFLFLPIWQVLLGWTYSFKTRCINILEPLSNSTESSKINQFKWRSEPTEIDGSLQLSPPRGHLLTRWVWR